MSYRHVLVSTIFLEQVDAEKRWLVKLGGDVIGCKDHVDWDAKRLARVWDLTEVIPPGTTGHDVEDHVWNAISKLPGLVGGQEFWYVKVQEERNIKPEIKRRSVHVLELMMQVPQGMMSPFKVGL